MKKIIYAIFTLVLVLNIAMIVNAEDLDKTAVALEGKTAAEMDALAIEAMKNSLMHENQRLHRLFSEDDLDDSVYNMYPSKSVDYGIHVATRYANKNFYKEIQTRFVIGNNINATDMSALYFMHYIGGGGLSLDSGIYYKDNKFYVFNFGTIDRKWDDSLLPNVSPGDTVYVNTRITNSQIITSVKKNGVLVGTQVNNLSKRVARLGFNMAREFNIASKKPLTGSDNYFSWSNAQSTLTTAEDKLERMNDSNSWLDRVKFDIEEYGAMNIMKFERYSYSSGGYIFDDVWCRCNFYR